MKKKIRLAVLMGGMSSEHDISIISGKEIIKNLDKKKYETYPIIISKKGKGIDKIFKIKPDLVFIALHGKFGEDGKIQGLLEFVGIPYTGSSVLASAIGMDKLIFRKIMSFELLPIPKYIPISKHDHNTKKSIKEFIDPPYFVKPYDQGSSIGASFVKDYSQLDKALKLAFEYSDIALVDEFIEGLEVDCGVLGNDKPVALPPIEIHPIKNKFFDYKSKYFSGGADEIVPAKISNRIAKEVQDMAIKVYKAVGAEGFARVDFILQNGFKPVVLEINTIPGMTPSSLLPKEAKAFGISYSELLDKIIEYAIKK